MNKHEHALAALRAGFKVLPLIGKDPVTNPNDPAFVPHGHLDASSKKPKIDRWFAGRDDLNIGTVIPDDAIVLDPDTDDGIATVTAAFGGTLPLTPTVRTGGGFRHIYLRWPKDEPVQRFTHKQGGQLWPGVDLLVRGYLVGVGSEHPDTHREYEWVHHPNDVPMIDAPVWLVERVREKMAAKRSAPTPLPAEGEIIREGEGRNSAVFAFMRSNHARGLTPEVNEAAARKFNEVHCRPSLPEAEMRRIIRSATTLLDTSEFAERQAAADDAVLDEGPVIAGGSGDDAKKPAPGRLNIRSLTDFMQEPRPERKWVWKPLLPQDGLAIMSSGPKAGKSTFLYPLLRAISRGEPFLGYETNQTNTLVVAVEESREDLAHRLDLLGLTNGQRKDDAPIYLHVGYLDPKAGLKQIRQAITEKQIGLLVIDTLATYWDIADEVDNSAMRDAIQPFLILAHELGVAVLLIYHDRKGGGENGEGLRGGSALLASVDQLLTLKRAGGTKREIAITGRYTSYGCPEKILVDFNMADYTYTVLSVDGDGKERAEEAWGNEQAVIEALALKPGQSEDRLAETTGIPGTTVHRLIGSLLSKGHVEDDPTCPCLMGSECERTRGVKGHAKTYRLPRPNTVQKLAA